MSEPAIFNGIVIAWFTLAAAVFLALWEAHYIHRAFIYPFSLRDNARQMPVAVVGFGLLFNMVNGYLNGRHIFTFSTSYTSEWLADPRFATGLVLFVAGFIINRQADEALRRLRRAGEPDYKIPYDGLYHWVSCPNYFGETFPFIYIDFSDTISGQRGYIAPGCCPDTAKAD